ncbi:putative sulfate exporter family transporter [Streptomyces sp. PRh5]|uniref:YeiH family protein n=1 Tax=Streptomyces sp. PRh5 TaxID=1158056 RepID=UPI0004B88C4D|nr:putative sulfate exporter family transporter [Streptomyces sp. PRh5]
MSEDLDRTVPARPEAEARPETGARPEAGPVRAPRPAVASLVPGLALVLALAVVGTAVGKVFPLVGGPVAGIVLGVLLAALRRPGARWRPGIGFASNRVLQASVVVLGSQLSPTQMVQVGVGSIPVLIGSLGVCLAAAYGIGRWLGIAGDLRTLIGVGTGVCGASAIAATAPVIGAAGVEVAYAVSTIFLFNIAAVLTFPLLGHLLGMSQHSFGLFAGTAVNDTSSVVAAATSYGRTAADHAVVVKLTRSLMIIPICLGLAWLVRRRDRAAVEATARPRLRVVRLVPGFLIGFLLMATANGLGFIPAAAHHGLGELSVFLITVALSATGLSTDLAALRRTGPRPLVLGACLWVVVSVTSLVLQFLTGSL